MLLLRSLMQATYETNNIGHYGLASDAYVHFTSPIRRYPDILVHRAVKRLLLGKKPDASPAALEALAESAQLSSERERSAMVIEREVVDLYRTLLMRDRVGDVCEGTVTALVGSGAFVALDDPFVEVLVKFERMGPDHYELSEDELSIVGSRSGDTIALGDRMVVVIDDVAVLRRTVYGMRMVPEAVLAKLGESAGRAGKPFARRDAVGRSSKGQKPVRGGRTNAQAAGNRDGARKARSGTPGNGRNSAPSAARGKKRGRR
jgi:ribonuclease R